ncbi:SMC domain protein [Methanococcus aeolicus Nankai-3]|uniref:DNA double-strand break repair Rad50 ATPase n=1 Tax=Methanococcus aeolicus (strain ATCC BAA-1280 / DSM 17508 / OCM 812 / Nankai-3) TaxID=419665 RepID=A6UUX2_META3|nr:AAA family ATPase [Methanococcus aeolicus]ABR56294.1 SMC domain protein [Methanococcus aeolicus Nankai-3]
MIIKNINIKNFRSHSNTDISFKQGITTIIGENGSGKSSIFEAMNYALFAPRRIKLSDAIKRGTDFFSISFEFEINGKRYKVIRGRGKKNINYLYENDKPYSENNDEVNNKIKEILNMDDEVFSNAIYIKQGDISSLIQITPAERKKLIGKLLGIERYEQVWDKLKTPLKNMELDLKKIEGELIQKEDINTNINNLKENMEKNSKILKELQDKFNHAVELRDRKEKLLKKWEKKEIENNNLQNNLKELKYGVETSENNIKILISDLGAINTHNNILNSNYLNYSKYKEIENKLKKLANELLQYKKYYDKFNELNGEMKGLEKTIKEIDKKLIDKNPKNKSNSEIEQEINDINKELNKLDDILNKLKDLELLNKELTKIENSKKELNKNKENYLKYLELSKKSKELNNKLMELSGIKEKENDLKQQIKSTEYKIKQLKQDLKDFNNIDIEINKEKEIKTKYEDIVNKIDLLKEKIAQNNAEINQTKDAIEKLKGTTEDKCPVCQSNIDGLKKQELLKQYNQLIEERKQKSNKLQIKYNKYLSEKKDIKDKLDKINNLKNKYGQLKEKNNNLIEEENKLIKLNNDLNVIGKDLEEYNKIIENIKTKENKLKELEQYYKKYEYCENFLKDSNEQELVDNKNKLLDIIGNNTNKSILNTKKELNNKVGELNELLNLIRNKEQNMKKLNVVNKEIDNLKDKVATNSQLEIEKNSNEKELIKYKDGYNQYNDSYAVLKNYADKYAVSIEEIRNKVNELLKKENNNLNNLNNEIQNIKLSIEKLQYNIEEFEDIKKDYNKINNKVNEINEDIIKLDTTIKNENKLLSEFENKLKQLEKLESKKEQLNNAIHNLANIREAVFSKNGFQQYLRQKYIPIIQRHTNEVFNEFELPYSHIEIKNDYDITVDDNPVKTLSGGEQIAVALAIRIGIAKAVCSDLNCIILDEPTAFLDENRRHNLLRVFRNIKSLSQIFVISHHSELEQVANNTITVEKNMGNSIIRSS